LTNWDGEVRELNADDLRLAVPFSALPEGLKALLHSHERAIVPDAEPKKEKRSAASVGIGAILIAKIGPGIRMSDQWPSE
jgi:hypothetical protein